MTHYLLAAEADKIQDFVFRSAHLREVVGGSQLLTWFCDKATADLVKQVVAVTGGPPPDMLIHDGGSFTIDFSRQDQATRFALALPDLYHRATGGTLTVAPLVAWSGGEADFKAANDTSRARLNLAKRAGRAAAAGEHLPYAAICASCGIELATTYATPPDRPGERGNYICESCLRKASQERNFLSKRFVEHFLQDGRGKTFQSEAVEEMAANWDRRNYVGYLVADGNGMGRLFGKCRTGQELSQLSLELSQRVMDALSTPAQRLMALAPNFQGDDDLKVPAMPLILGGDDVFVRMPAPYALDFALQFCREYEKAMLPIAQAIDPQAKPTISAAVVICKAKYPHYLAHRYGEELLGKAKAQSKRFAEDGCVRSCINFGVFLGSRLNEGDGHRGPCRPTLKPYWIGEVPSDAGLDLQALLDARFELRELPRGRLAQLEALFDSDQIPARDDAVALGRWEVAFKQLRTRIKQRSERQAKALDASVARLGGSWRSIRRPGPSVNDRPFSGHPLPDLLDAWDYSLMLDKSRAEYGREEE
jgi:hypothetical protein